MTLYNDWVVQYKNGATWTEISNVQELSCFVGRQNVLDRWQVSSANFRVWYPSGYNSPLANFDIGTFVRFFAPGRASNKPSWTGQVKEFRVELGQLWNGTTNEGRLDFLVVECEGGLANNYRTGSTRVTADADGKLTVPSCVDDFLFKAPADVASYDWFEWSAASTYAGSLLGFWSDDAGDMIDQLQAMSFMRICDGVRKTWTGSFGDADDPAVFIGKPAPSSSDISSVGFSDTNNNSTNRVFDQVDFRLASDSIVNAVSIDYRTWRTLITTNVETGTGNTSADRDVTPRRELQLSWPQQLAAPGDDVASLELSPPNIRRQLRDYYIYAYSEGSFSISSISARASAQNTRNLDTLGVTDLELGYLPLYVMPVTLRGTTYYVQIEGVQITADTSDTRFTYYVTPVETSAWFRVDSSVLGVLDQNRLGIY